MTMNDKTRGFCFGYCRDILISSFSWGHDFQEEIKGNGYQVAPYQNKIRPKLSFLTQGLSC